MKGKKLPDVWVNFSPNNIPCLVTLSKARAAAAILPSCRETVHRYTTAKPAKVCRWKVSPSGWNVIGCSKKETTEEPRKFCPDCGGKIKVTR